MKEFEIEIKQGEKAIIHKLVQAKKIPKMYLQLAEELINSVVTIKRLK